MKTSGYNASVCFYLCVYVRELVHTLIQLQ